jgi:hypothetical protein
MYGISSSYFKASFVVVCVACSLVVRTEYLLASAARCALRNCVYRYVCQDMLWVPLCTLRSKCLLALHGVRYEIVRIIMCGMSWVQ